MKILRFDLKSDFGFFKKPDINDSIYLTYNIMHKPALLGILGAILGLKGHYEYGKLPEYYQKLNFLRVAIEPIGTGQTNGNFEKTIVKYNNATGHANAGATLNILEQILIKPEFRIYIQLDNYSEENKEDYEEVTAKLKHKIIKGESTFIPYFGKNDFSCWWNSYECIEVNATEIKSDSFYISSIFSTPDGKKLDNIKKQVAFGLFAGIKANPEKKFTLFERLPVTFDAVLKQYKPPEKFIYTNIEFSKDNFDSDNNFVQLEGDNNVIYLF